MQSIVKEIKRELKGKAKIFVFDFEENPKLAYKFNVINLPTFIIYRNGKKVKTLVAFRRKKSYYHY